MEGGNGMKMVVSCSLLVRVSVHGGMLTMASSWWGKGNYPLKKVMDIFILFVIILATLPSRKAGAANHLSPVQT
jgi:hypothetical protein